MKNELLIDQESFQIAWHESLSVRNAATLQAVHSLHAIPTHAAATQAAAQSETIIRGLMEVHHKKMIGVIPDIMTLVMPPEIAALKNALQSLKSNLAISYRQIPFPSGFQFVAFDGKSWIVDQDGLNGWNTKFYIYADPLRYEVASKIVEQLNRVTGLTEGEKIHLYATPIAKYSAASGRFEIVNQFLRQ